MAGPERGISTSIAAVVLAVVVVIAGAATYAAFARGGAAGSRVSSCTPIPLCPSQFAGATADVHLFVPLKSAQQNATLPFTASVPSPEAASSFSIDFGDGSPPAVTTTGVADHAYAFPGTYLASATAVVRGVQHNSYLGLVAITVTPSFASVGSGTVPQVTGVVTANQTSTSHPTTVVPPGATVSVAGSYTAAPTNPSWTLVAPTIAVSTGGTILANASSTGSASAKVSFSSAGPHTVAFVGTAHGPSAAIAHQEYVWTVFVAATGTAGVPGAAVRSSPHPGTILSYENTPGGTYSSDPAIDYDIVGFEILINVYETLVFYNGSQTGPGANGFVPVIATCVPGSAECQSLYGSTLQNGTDWTFVISKSAHFYDPSTKASWPVYPTDVLFSIARTMAFSTQPCVGCNNGWILTQSLLGPGSPTWDPSGVHQSYNNTPARVFAAVTVNESKYCTSAMMTGDDGCVTFHANATGLNWPYFLQLIGDTEGGGIVPCGWFSASAHASGIPYWTQGNVTGSGDHPCPMPGVGGYGVAPSAMPLTGWDAWEFAGSGASGTYLGDVANNMVGSGPYYMYNYLPGSSFALKASPAYQANPNCAGPACYPAPGKFAGNVSVVWENGPQLGENALSTGIADYAGIPPTDLGFLLQEIESGQANVLSIPTINIYFLPFVLNINIPGISQVTSASVNVPADWFSYLGMRQFFVHAYPYATIQSSVNTKDGIETGFPFGGAIPQFLGDYYPKSVAWPSGDPCSSTTDIGCSAYWWAQITSSSSVYYDPEASACTTSSPCHLPLFGVLGDSDTDQRIALWIAQIEKISGGRILPELVDLPEASIVTGQFSPPGANYLSVYSIRWVPDYPDPTDYVRPLYNPDNVYTFSSAVSEQLSLTAFNQSSGCPGSATNYAVYAALAQPVSNGCQGDAFWAMNRALQLAGPMPDNATRVALYAQAEAIANQLALYVYMFQQELVPALGPWVDGSTFNTNPIIGAGGDTPWFWIGGNSVAYPGST